MKKRILAIGAHPDDIEIGCCGTLFKYSKTHEIFYIIATLGEGVEDTPHKKKMIREQRKFESVGAANLLNIKEIFYLDLYDTFIKHDGDTVKALEKVLSKVNPSLIFTHTLEDNHQDHKNLGFATLSACRRSKSNILHYETPSTSQNFTPIVYSDITRYIDKKNEVLSYFVSQNQKRYLDEDAIKGLSRYRGYTSGFLFAEAFEVTKFFI